MNSQATFVNPRGRAGDVSTRPPSAAAAKPAPPTPIVVAPPSVWLPAWHVLQTRSRQEKAVGRLLAEVGAEPFLPVIRQTKHYGHRRRTAEIPLFATYIFAWGTIEQAWELMRSGRVVRVLPVVDQARLAVDVEQLRKAVQGDASLSPFRYLERGVRVRVTSGPFKDLEGVVEAGVKANRLVLQIRALGRATSLEIDACLLARVRDDEDFA